MAFVGRGWDRIPLWIYGFAFLGALLILPWIGGEPLYAGDVIEYLAGGRNPRGLIFIHHRVPRVLLGLLVGGALSMAGAALQILFRNPLAEPWTLGVSGGSALAVFFAHAFPGIQVAFGPLTSVQLLALGGAYAVMGIILLLARAKRRMSPQGLLLSGVTISITSAGLIMFVTYTMSPFRLITFHRWMMGGLDVVGYGEVLSFLALGLIGLLILGGLAKEYDHIALGEENAMGHGVDVKAVQRATFFGAGIATAACVSLAGPIGFVGMIVPHVVRHLSGFRSTVVLPGSFFLGGVVLAVCDCAARTVFAPTELPVGIMTAVLGGVIFLFFLGKGQNKSY